MLNGHMCCGVEKKNLVLRVGPKQYETILKKKGARPMDLTGRPLTGFVYVSPQAIKTDASLRDWLKSALVFAGSLPKK